jgi:hypothetical protein
MYPIEKLFIIKFIACLKAGGVDEIPHDKEKFNKGAEAMLSYFNKNKTDLGKYSDELSMLFLKNPQGGVFSELRGGIERQNGGLMSFDNPLYVHAEIKLKKEGADYILNQNDIDIEKKHLFGFSEAFCVAAEIPFKMKANEIQ